MAIRALSVATVVIRGVRLEQREVAEGGGSAVDPVFDVVGVGSLGRCRLWSLAHNAASSAVLTRRLVLPTSRGWLLLPRTDGCEAVVLGAP